VHLGGRGAGDRLGLELVEHVGGRRVPRVLQRLLDLLERQRRRRLGVRALHLGDGALAQLRRQRRGIDRVAQPGEGEPGGAGAARYAHGGVGERAERLEAGVSGH